MWWELRYKIYRYEGKICEFLMWKMEENKKESGRCFANARINLSFFDFLLRKRFPCTYINISVIKINKCYQLLIAEL